MSTLLEPASSPATPRARPRPSTDNDDRTQRQGGEIRKLTTLLEVSQALATPPNIKLAFHRVLEILERFHGTSRSVIALPRDEARRLYLQASIGIRTPHADTPLAPNLAQQVFESGRPVVVPRVSQEPGLAALSARPDGMPRGRSARRDFDEDDLTYICVPVQQSRQCRGVLEVELAYRSDRNYDRSMKFYGVVGSMLAQALKMQSLMESDRQRLVNENVRLRDELRERYDFSHILGTSGARADGTVDNSLRKTTGRHSRCDGFCFGPGLAYNLHKCQF